MSCQINCFDISDPCFSLQNDVNLFKEYLSHFIAMYKEFIDVGFTSLNEGWVYHCKIIRKRCTGSEPIHFLSSVVQLSIQVPRHLCYHSSSFINEGPHLTRLPEGLLQMVLQQLTHCSQWCLSAESQLLSGSQDEEMEAATQDTLVYIVDLLKCLIVVSR